MDNIRQGRRNQAVGKEAEKLVIGVLQSHGLNMVEKIGTPVRMIPYRTNTGHKPRGVFRVIFGDQVSGDIRAFTPDGQGVLVEVKYTGDIDRFQFSRLEDHQVSSLWDCLKTGGLPLLAWVNDWGVHILRWPVTGFKKGTSIKLDEVNGHLWEGV